MGIEQDWSVMVIVQTNKETCNFNCCNCWSVRWYLRTHMVVLLLSTDLIYATVHHKTVVPGPWNDQ